MFRAVSMALKIIAENQIKLMIPAQPRSSFFPSIWPNWVSRSPEKEGMNWRIPSMSFFWISGSALKRLADQQQRQDEQRDDRQDGVQGDGGGLVRVAVRSIVADGVAEDVPGGGEAEADDARRRLDRSCVRSGWDSSIFSSAQANSGVTVSVPASPRGAPASAASISAAPIP